MKFRIISTIVVSLALSVGTGVGVVSATTAGKLPNDPLESVMWKSLAEKYFSDGPIVFDSRVKVMVPKAAENQFHVPVTVDASGLKDVKQIVVLTDLNPVAHVLTYKPKNAKPFIGFRVKVEQTTPVRAGVQTADGTWHIGGTIVDAAGGGCSAPATAQGDKDWLKRLGKTKVLVNRVNPDLARVTVRMRHPMDTGFAFGHPAFFMNQLDIRDKNERLLSSIEMSEPVSENPTLTIEPLMQAGAQQLLVDARDNDGNQFGYSVAVPAAQQD